MACWNPWWRTSQPESKSDIQKRRTKKSFCRRIPHVPYEPSACEPREANERDGQRQRIKLFWKLLETFINILWLICSCAIKNGRLKNQASGERWWRGMAYQMWKLNSPCVAVRARFSLCYYDVGFSHVFNRLFDPQRLPTTYSLRTTNTAIKFLRTYWK